ncbi:MAG: tetratricopeptide repeat protein [Acidobacteriaceae bacterium]
MAQDAPGQDFQALLRQGFDLHRQARYSEAIPILERARKLHPRDYFANLLLGIDLLRTGKFSEALPPLELAARTRPAEEIPEVYLGEAEASLGRYAQAAEAYQQAVQRGHRSEQALEAWAGFSLERFRQIGEGLRASSEGVAAIRRLEKAAAQPAGTLVCHGSIPVLERSLTEKLLGRSSAATQMETAYNLSICYALAAGKAAGELQSSAEDQAALHRLRGDVFLRLKGDAKAAEGEYRKAIALRPGDPALLERLAEAESMEGNTDAARQSALAALAIDPHQREALRTLASVAMSNRDYDQALPWLRRLSLEAPGDPAVQVQLGTALAETGSAAKALQHLAPALAGGYPDEKGALHALEARILRQLGREKDAAKAAAEARRLSDAFQEHPQNPSTNGPHAD